MRQLSPARLWRKDIPKLLDTTSNKSPSRNKRILAPRLKKTYAKVRRNVRQRYRGSKASPQIDDVRIGSHPKAQLYQEIAKKY